MCDAAFHKPSTDIDFVKLGMFLVVCVAWVGVSGELALISRIW